jgi:predicted amidohydrolase YtcJ
MDLVIRNAKVWTVDERRSTAEAVGVRGGRIAAVGDDREVRDAVGADAEELDAGGNTVLPGFIDAHNHLRTGADADAVQLGDATTLDAVRAAIDRYAHEHPDRGHADTPAIFATHRDAPTDGDEAVRRRRGWQRSKQMCLRALLRHSRDGRRQGNDDDTRKTLHHTV